ncbi:heavy metal-responsive transcriptional regulator [Cellulomonas fimi]|uniref:Heavy metal-responsive transcriptional regulator n=1 Tax=Cellulomonas fimi TaxID=1708 RepID=A0A7Y0LZS3_CELFI|nr:heavy metal-responsive transcriptional regulator [Cellulomonas fimi]NMR21221.1 heavy metal-responsive transcriptional regulator [Cellulomonas fimi]
MLIGELAQASGTTTKTLRYYEQAGLIPAPGRTAGGYRDYPPEALSRLDFIRRGQAAGLTLAQVRGVLDVRDRGLAPCEHVHDLLDAHLTALDRQIADLHALRDTVAGLRDSVDTIDPATCAPGTICRYI